MTQTQTKQPLTHWKLLHNPDYLGSYAFQPEQEITATIQSVGLEMVAGTDGKKEECTVARFKEGGIKPMVLNVTNCKTLTKMYGTPYIEEWQGRRLQIYVAKVKAFGDTVDALRIRPREPQAVLPELTPVHPKWAGAVKSFRQGDTGIDGIRKYFTLSDENAERLKEEAANA